MTDISIRANSIRINKCHKEVINSSMTKVIIRIIAGICEAFLIKPVSWSVLCLCNKNAMGRAHGFCHKFSPSNLEMCEMFHSCREGLSVAFCSTKLHCKPSYQQAIFHHSKLKHQWKVNIYIWLHCPRQTPPFYLKVSWVNSSSMLATMPSL